MPASRADDDRGRPPGGRPGRSGGRRQGDLPAAADRRAAPPGRLAQALQRAGDSAGGRRRGSARPVHRGRPDRRPGLRARPSSRASTGTGLGAGALCRTELRRKGVDADVAGLAAAPIDSEAERRRAEALIARRVDSAMAGGYQSARRRLSACWRGADTRPTSQRPLSTGRSPPTGKKRRSSDRDESGALLGQAAPPDRLTLTLGESSWTGLFRASSARTSACPRIAGGAPRIAVCRGVVDGGNRSTEWGSRGPCRAGAPRRGSRSATRAARVGLTSTVGSLTSSGNRSVTTRAPDGCAGDSGPCCRTTRHCRDARAQRSRRRARRRRPRRSVCTTLLPRRPAVRARPPCGADEGGGPMSDALVVVLIGALLVTLAAVVVLARRRPTPGPAIDEDTIRRLLQDATRPSPEPRPSRSPSPISAGSRC